LNGEKCEDLAVDTFGEEIGGQKHEIIYADPGWRYRDKAKAGSRGVDGKYKSTMSMDEIVDLPVQQIATDNAYLFLWVTSPLIGEIIQSGLMKHWGFKQKNVAFTWIKTTKHGKLHWGMGNWTRANPEFCLLGIRGKPKRISCAVHSVVMAPIGPHSRKPDVVRDRIVELCGDLPRVELFARQRTPGWLAWGDELTAFNSAEIRGGS
jgi:N6-adenosine-specific RNA methylase IME4